MKIAVCMKQVPAASEGNMDPETGVLLRAGLQACIHDGTAEGRKRASGSICHGGG